MPQYLVCNYLPDNFDPSTITEAMVEEVCRWDGPARQREDDPEAS